MRVTLPTISLFHLIQQILPLFFLLESFFQFLVSLDLVQTSTLLHTIPLLHSSPGSRRTPAGFMAGYPATNPYFIKTAWLSAQFVYFPLRISFRIKNRPVRSDILPHSLEKSLEPFVNWPGGGPSPMHTITLLHELVFLLNSDRSQPN